MFTVALIGPDGAGKSTICRRVQKKLWPLRTARVYMGINLEASDLLLPTTRVLLELRRVRGRRTDMAGPRHGRKRTAPQGWVRSTVAAVKSSLRMVNLVCEEWFRQVVISHHLRRQRIVLLDRDFYLDYYHADIEPPVAQRPWTSRIHGLLLQKFYPKPDLVIQLDAPAESLFARKGEASRDYLHERRQQCHQLARVVPHFYCVDTTPGIDRATCDVARLIREFYNRRRKTMSRRHQP